MKVLVTGGAGFLGSHVCEYYRAKGEEVIAYDNMTKHELARTGYNADKARDYMVAFLRGIGASLIVADVRDLARVCESARGADLIVHCAAQPAMTIALEKPLFDLTNNVEGTANVLQAARKHGAAVLNCSTIHIYGTGINDIIVEDKTRYKLLSYNEGFDESTKTMTGDITPLHASKHAAEWYCRAYADSYGLKVATFRLTGMYGPRQFGGEDHGWVANFAIKTLMEYPIKVFGTDKQVRDIIYVKDVVEAIDAWYKEGAVPGIYNIGGGWPNNISLGECLNLLSELTGIKQNIMLEPARKGDLYYFCCDTTKASLAFNWHKSIKNKDGIINLLEWIMNNKEIFKQ